MWPHSETHQQHRWRAGIVPKDLDCFNVSCVKIRRPSFGQMEPRPWAEMQAHCIIVKQEQSTHSPTFAFWGSVMMTTTKWVVGQLDIWVGEHVYTKTAIHKRHETRLFILTSEFLAPVARQNISRLFCFVCWSSIAGSLVLLLRLLCSDISKQSPCTFSLLIPQSFFSLFFSLLACRKREKSTRD